MISESTRLRLILKEKDYISSDYVNMGTGIISMQLA
jgi:hypothetical protein